MSQSTLHLIFNFSERNVQCLMAQHLIDFNLQYHACAHTIGIHIPSAQGETRFQSMQAHLILTGLFCHKSIGHHPMIQQDHCCMEFILREICVEYFI